MALTPSAFERIWDELLEEIGWKGWGLQDVEDETDADFDLRTLEDPTRRRELLHSGKVGAYLYWCYQRHTKWGGPWVQAVFTAGMRAIQCVESNHHVIELFLRSSATTLPTLFQAILNKVEDEVDIWRYTTTKGASLAPTRSMLSAIFEDVLDNGHQYLSFYSQTELRQELKHSFNHSLEPIDFESLDDAVDQRSSLVRTSCQNRCLCLL